ncbi:MAG: threonine/serine exporter family protein [Spongiibacteraceae bacterium]|nr:threonine/serine exporter family protein [Spongiibacteraceae bacterium]
MSAAVERADFTGRYWINPLHAFFLAGCVPLFLGALLSDIAYARTYQIQWNNFASWLLAGALVVAGLALLCAVIDLVRLQYRSGQRAVYTVLLAATWLVGFIDALTHAKDAWASMPTALVLSVIVVVLAAAASWLGFGGLRAGGDR